MTIHYKVGDATRPDERNAVLVHCCNNIGGWGSGFVLAINNTFGYGPRNDYLAMTERRLGAVRMVPVDVDDSNVDCIVNLIGQNGVRSDDNPTPIDYQALAVGLARMEVLNAVLTRSGISFNPIVMPRIGCGLAGGEWHKVAEIIDFILFKHDVYVYDLPGTVPGKDYNE